VDLRVAELNRRRSVVPSCDLSLKFIEKVSLVLYQGTTLVVP
jgi:hypothetical protein